MVEGGPPKHQTLMQLHHQRVAANAFSLAQMKLMDIRSKTREQLPKDADRETQLLHYVHNLESEYAAALNRLSALEEKVRDLTDQMNLYSIEERRIEKLVSYSSNEDLPAALAAAEKSKKNLNNNTSGSGGDWKWNPLFSASGGAMILKRNSSAVGSGVADVVGDEEFEDEERKASSPSPISYLKVVKRSSVERDEAADAAAAMESSGGGSGDLTLFFTEEDVEDPQKRGVLNFFLKRNGWFNYRTGDIVMRCRIQSSLDMDEVKRIMPNLKVGTEKNNKLVKAHLTIGSGRILEKMAQIKKGSLVLLCRGGGN
jgi:hypothetical protein